MYTIAMLVRRALAPTALVCLLGACDGQGHSGSDPIAASEKHAATAAALEDSDDGGELPALSALGYVDWDDNADVSLSGVTLHDRERSWPGYDIYTNDQDEAYLISTSGERLHTWRVPGATHLELFELYEDGSIAGESEKEGLARVDWDSKPIWRAQVHIHHDVRRLPSGSFLVIAKEQPRPYKGRIVQFDQIVEISAEGKQRKLWSTFEHLEELRRIHPPSPLDRAPKKGTPDKLWLDYYHMNCVEPLPPTELGENDERFRAGNLLICLPRVNLIAILDRDSFDVVWSWGPKHLEFAHTPTLLENGNILVFDNGQRRGDSRVLELDPRTKEIVWSYTDPEKGGFYSEWRGSNQRLPNGNTLICESERGYVFEVTPDGEKVWEFWNPDLVDGSRRRIYRYARLERDFVEPILAAQGLGSRR